MTPEIKKLARHRLSRAREAFSDLIGSRDGYRGD